jgi:hypothetical protein
MTTLVVSTTKRNDFTTLIFEENVEGNVKENIKQNVEGNVKENVEEMATSSTAKSNLTKLKKNLIGKNVEKDSRNVSENLSKDSTQTLPVLGKFSL